MNIAEHEIETLSGRAKRIPELSRAELPRRGYVYFACVILALCCNYFLGKDMAWDTLNYQLYLGFSAVNDRFAQDYFAAGPLAYLNPYAYVPFYAMVRAGLPALLICSIFAAAHSIILWLSFELGVAVCPEKDAHSRVFAGICSVALAFMNPILMQQIGSCFADITTAELALLGWLLMARAVRAPRISSIAYAGLVLGVASALKLSNALSAVSALPMLGLLPLDWRGKARYVVIYGVSITTAFAIVSAPWSSHLQATFGNPMFPMFNNIFRSPEFPTGSMGNAGRFIPESSLQALWRPFAMIDPTRNVHEELSAPDPRYAILIVLVALLFVRRCWRHLTHTSPSATNPRFSGSARVLAALGFGLSLNWTIWLYVSGNSRYALTMSCIAAAVIVGILFRLFQPKTRNYILAGILATQGIQLCLGAEYRWNAAAWGGPWFDLSVPTLLKTEPNLYLTLGTQSNSFIAPFVNLGSGFANIAGGYTLNPDGADGAHVKALLRKYWPNIRLAFRTSEALNNEKSRDSHPQVGDALLEYGLRPDLGDCATIAIRGLTPDLEIRFQTPVPQPPQNRDTTFIATCRVVPDNADRSALAARRAAVDRVFDRLEDACPRLFQPARLVSVHRGDLWERVYATDIVAWISHGRVRFSDQFRPHGIVDVGSEDDWANGRFSLECGRRGGLYFANVLRANR